MGNTSLSQQCYYSECDKENNILRDQVKKEKCGHMIRKPTTATESNATATMQSNALEDDGLIVGYRRSRTQGSTEPIENHYERPKETPEQQDQRMFRKGIAEANYKLRTKWRVPKTVAVPYKESVTAKVERFERDAQVSFSSMTTADAILHFCQDPKTKVTALNFANGKRVGGGYKTGANAQEEDLCRRLPNFYTTLFNAKKTGLYPFGPSTCLSPDNPAKYSDVLFTPGVVVARLSEEEGFQLLPPARQARVSVVTAAAPNVNFATDVYNLDLMYNTVKSIFIVPRWKMPETTTLVLGAWGCGAFGCNPNDISALFARALQEDGMGRLYKEVHFAIPGKGPRDKNAVVFRETFKRHGVDLVELHQH